MAAFSKEAPYHEGALCGGPNLNLLGQLGVAQKSTFIGEGNP